MNIVKAVENETLEEVKKVPSLLKHREKFTRSK